MRILWQCLLAWVGLTIGLAPLVVTAGGLDTAGRAATLSDLEGGEWKLRALTRDGHPVDLAADAVSTFQVQESGKVAGSGGVNRYFGSVNVTEGGTLEWGKPGFGSTMMAGPQEHMDQEYQFLQSLQTVRKATIHDGRLLLRDAAGTTMLEFER
jgi:heat shock protein HslJ